MRIRNPFKRRRVPPAPELAPDPGKVEELLRDQRPVVVPVVATGLPWGAIADVWRNLTALLRDNRGKMSSKRFGAGALIYYGIYLTIQGSTAQNNSQLFGGCFLCLLGVVLFALTRLEIHDQP